ncbi:hypothetical protein SPM24T3_23192 [Serratia sp. M24T3]|nr:hypothetical protein SPM24T3_23192 [Serratia sp. M24T3]
MQVQSAVHTLFSLTYLDALFITIIVQDYNGTKEKVERRNNIVKPLHKKKDPTRIINLLKKV